MTDYKKWTKWADAYDSDGESTSLQIPLDAVSEDYLKNIDFSNVTAECGKPMTQEEFDRYVSGRKDKTLLVQPTRPSSSP